MIGTVNDSNPPVPIPDESIIVKCANCWLLYVNPIPFWDDSDYVKLYTEEYFAGYQDEEKKPWMQLRKYRIPEIRFKLIEKHIKSPDKTLLEIGAGESAFMCQYLINKGWETTAQEPNTIFNDRLKNIKGLNVETKSVLDINEENQYSLIYSDSVLEHVANPNDYLKKITKMLKPGGVFYNVSPNEYSMNNYINRYIAKLMNKTPRYISPYKKPYHLIGFTKRAYEILAKNSSLQLVFYKKMEDYNAFQMINSNRKAIVRFPLALLYYIAQKLGLGTNGEALFVKPCGE